MEVPGVPKKMFLSKKGAYLTKGHFFWDTLYGHKKDPESMINAQLYLHRRQDRVQNGPRKKALRTYTRTCKFWYCLP